ncbi:cytospin-A-like [Limulus polyphemus]|uniref:Cytospin-A-like n=1 Tax=Limulus polyphemus TaxID=6850 RepID=A0ABM1BQ74_LIMPO|nr:cytospin-A-like [Limulus polyphemus]XP_022254847.1 cytospin-A-like [Limulus polyphemus]XP_022254848.1 cytospin-A-like [Limulus polyphemus]XP_022254850.1 cytospin-A-like [Limulus polyphemus]XP_022254851.1 cytospin-A-like [Limulus polyphemus]XP_022254852.1 cytospin-A-like [Limulus polyphemus]
MKNTQKSSTMKKENTATSSSSKGSKTPSSGGSYGTGRSSETPRAGVERSATTGSLVGNRKTSSSQKHSNKTLAGSQDSLTSSQVAHTKRKISVPVKSSSQAVLGSQKGKGDTVPIKSVNKENIQTPNSGPSEQKSSNRKIPSGNMRRAFSKDSIDSSGNREREKENLGGSRLKSKKSSIEVTVSLLEKEKNKLKHQVSELVRNAEGKKVEIAALKMENKRLKEQNKEIRDHHLYQETEALQAENRSLKERLVEMGAPLDQVTLSDSEKEQLLLRRSVSGSLASLEVESLRKDDSTVGSDQTSPVPGASEQDTLKSRGVCSPDQESESGEASGVTLPPPGRPLAEWDKMSSSSISEMSLSCLQDRIMQMEETHYSTSEELQATLQELTDLQDQVTELQLENEQMRSEKAVLLESLCSQTEKLEDYREQVEHFKPLLFRLYEEGAETAQSASEREEHILVLLKKTHAQVERLMAEKEELTTALQAAKEEAQEHQREREVLHDRLRLLSSTVESVRSDKQLLDTQLSESLEQLAAKQIEIDQLKLQLESQQQKVRELHRERDANATSELDAMLREARKDKGEVEEKAMKLQEQLALSQRETVRVKEQLFQLQEETMVIKNNAKKEVSDLKYKAEQLEADKTTVQKRYDQAELKCQRYLEDKRELKTTISELQKSLNETQSQLEELKKMFDETKHKHETETDEWKRFQDDLLTTVRVANDFKTEAQRDREKLESENKMLQEKTAKLEAEMHKLKAKEDGHISPPSQQRSNSMRSISSNSSLPGTDAAVLTSVERDLAVTRRQLGSAKWQDYRNGPQLSVRTLIESIESATKQAKGPGSSRSSSTSSLNSIASDSRLPANSLIIGNTSDIFVKPPLRSVASDATLMCDGKTNGHTGRLQKSSFVEGTPIIPTDSTGNTSSKVLGETDTSKSSNSHPVSILASKLDPLRRNSSYSDLAEKKDPLSALVKGGGSKRNALLKWCQNKTIGYKNIDITNFSSSWNDGLAFCAILHTYLPDLIPYNDLDNKDKKRNFTIAFKAAESVGISTTLNLNELISLERPDWQSIMAYVTSLYKHFET